MQNKIKDLPVTERPQERLIKIGAGALTNSELLAIILRSGNRNEGVMELSSRILREFRGLNGLLDASFEELKKVSGVKEAKAAQIVALSELFRRFRSIKSGSDYRITSPSDVSDLLMMEMRELKREMLKVVLLSTKNNVISVTDASIGSLNSSIVHPREVYKDAIRRSAAAIIIVHNHPSGDPTPSGEDITTTKRINEAGKILGIDLLDHIIIGENRYISLKEEGFI